MYRITGENTNTLPHYLYAYKIIDDNFLQSNVT